jgi:predicted phage terminase large subunit-like protein
MALSLSIANPIDLFAMQYYPHKLVKPVAPFHRDLTKVLSNRDVYRIAIEAGRGMAKTTWASDIYVGYEICEGPYEEIQVFTQSGGTTGLSTKILKRIKRELDTNDLLRADYGIQRGSAWGQDYIEVKRGDGKIISVYCRGKHSSARGNRGLVLLDDVQDINDCKSETVLAADEDWFFSDIVPILLDEQRLVFIGTSISPLSLLSKVKALPNYTVLEFPVEDPPGSGHSAWPEQYSDQFLEDRKREIGIDRYKAEYLCKPMVSGNPVFREEWLKSYDPGSVEFRKLEALGLYTVVGYDGAHSKQTSADYTALVVLQALPGPQPKVFVREVMRERWTNKEGVRMLFKLQEKWQQHKTVMESMSEDSPAIEEARDQERYYRRPLYVHPVKPIHDKVTRAQNIQGMVQSGQLYVNKDDPAQQGLISEMIMFTGDGKFHDDRVDALVHGMTDIKETCANSGMEIKSGIGESW